MLSKRLFSAGIATLFLGATALGQDRPSVQALPSGHAMAGQTSPAPASILPDSQAGAPQACCQDEPAPWGPTAPENVKLLMSTPPGQLLDRLGLRSYGWFDGGYTYSSSGRGALAIEPRENRFGDEFLVNQLALVLEKPLDEKRLSVGFNATLWAGADPSLIAPLGGIQTGNNPRFGLDFRQLYLSAHLPILTEGGVDVKVGRMGTVIGYESALAPYRPFYSNDYQWFYAQDGAFTGVLTTAHLTKQLDFVNGITFGANTFFTRRGTGVCYLGQVNYWVQEEKKTLLSTSIYLGNNAIFAAPGMAGTFDTTLELRVQHKWSPRFEQIVQSDMGWDANTPVGTGAWYSLYNIFVLHLAPKLDVNFRGEWFDDVGGTRTGVNANYGETTLGLDYHPIKALSFRPEVRGDYASAPAFRNGQDRTQLTVAFDILAKF